MRRHLAAVPSLATLHQSSCLQTGHGPALVTEFHLPSRLVEAMFSPSERTTRAGQAAVHPYGPARTDVVDPELSLSAAKFVAQCEPHESLLSPVWLRRDRLQQAQ